MFASGTPQIALGISRGFLEISKDPQGPSRDLQCSPRMLPLEVVDHLIDHLHRVGAEQSAAGHSGWRAALEGGWSSFEKIRSNKQGA